MFSFQIYNLISASLSGGYMLDISALDLRIRSWQIAAKSQNSPNNKTDALVQPKPSGIQLINWTPLWKNLYQSTCLNTEDISV